MQIHAVQTGTVMIRASQPNGSSGSGYLRLINTLRDPNWTPPLPINVWVIEHPEGVIVVDTGETANALKPGHFPWWHPFYRFGFKEAITPDDEVGPQLRKIGISPDDVRWVVMTHLHTDHAGGIYHFPKSEFIVGRTEFAATGGFNGQLLAYLPQHFPDWFKPRLIDFKPQATASQARGSFPVSYPLTQAGDVLLVPTPGHTDGHLSVILREGDQSIFFAGDTSYSEAHLLKHTVDGVTQDQASSRQTLDRINQYVRSTPTVYLPTHDPGSADRLARRAVVQP
ncbi:MAG: N-acyl homoserine lactonase family protein [Chloroflexota bacterium]